jgi:hypothetical protein
MNDLEELKGRGFRMMLTSSNYQALFGALALAMIGLAAILWHGRTSLFFVLAASFSMFLCAFVQQRMFERIAFAEAKPTKLSILAARALWYAAIAFGALAFAALV